MGVQPADGSDRQTERRGESVYEGVTGEQQRTDLERPFCLTHEILRK